MNLTVKHHRAIASLLTGASVKASAQAAGVSVRTVHRWQDDAAFVDALRAAEGRLIDAQARRLLNLQDRALSTLAKAIDDPAATWAERLRACGLVMTGALRLRELRNAEERIAELERRLSELLGNEDTNTWPGH